MISLKVSGSNLSSFLRFWNLGSEFLGIPNDWGSIPHANSHEISAIFIHEVSPLALELPVISELRDKFSNFLIIQKFTYWSFYWIISNLKYASSLLEQRMKFRALTNFNSPSGLRCIKLSGLIQTNSCGCHKTKICFLERFI